MLPHIAFKLLELLAIALELFIFLRLFELFISVGRGDLVLHLVFHPAKDALLLDLFLRFSHYDSGSFPFGNGLFHGGDLLFGHTFNFFLVFLSNSCFLLPGSDLFLSLFVVVRESLIPEVLSSLEFDS